MEIKLLNEETISRIAAGEVIERPLNVAKELVENSIDAGATAITVEIRDGGIKMIRVTDNGCGIEKEQIRAAFVRHATSKIRDAEDLYHLGSLGFRGEALASIASVARVEMITKVRESLMGTRAVNDHLASYSPDAPVQFDLSEIGAPDGTTVIVRNLFDSIPVRRRFLRQPQTEAGYITDLMEKQALSHPDISFHYRVNGQDKLHTSGNGNLKELIYRIYGRETAGAIIPVQAEDPDSGMRLDGFLGKPEISRSTRNFEIFFVNGRMLRSKELSAGLEEGYRTDLMQHRFPFAVLHLTVPPENVDVNVHPSKMEVRFTDRRSVFHFLDTAVYDALRQIERIPKAGLLTAREERVQARKEAEQKNALLQTGPRLEAFESGRVKRTPPPENSLQTASGQEMPEIPGTSEMPGTPDMLSSKEEGILGTAITENTLFFDDRRRPAPAADQGKENAQNDLKDPYYKNRPGSLHGPAGPEADELLMEESPVYAFGAQMTLQDLAAASAGMDAEHGSNVSELNVSGSNVSGPNVSGPNVSGANVSGSNVSGEDIHKGDVSDGTMSPPQKEERFLTKTNAEHFHYIGQVFGTYWMIEYNKRLLIIDQHAAHEKVNYERMMRRITQEHPDLDEERTVRDALPEEYLALDRLLQPVREDAAAETAPVYVASQQLMPSTIVRMSGREELAYLQFRTVFAAMGYEIEDFGGGSYAIRAVPTELFGSTPDALLREILEEIMNERISGTPRAVIAKIASMSCKAAVKGNTRLSETEARALIRELLALENPYHCPHGRPTMIIISQYEMDRKFKRIV